MAAAASKLRRCIDAMQLATEAREARREVWIRLPRYDGDLLPVGRDHGHRNQLRQRSGTPAPRRLPPTLPPPNDDPKTPAKAEGKGTVNGLEPPPKTKTKGGASGAAAPNEEPTRPANAEDKGKRKTFEPPSTATTKGGASGAAVPSDEPQQPANAEDKRQGERIWRR